MRSIVIAATLISAGCGNPSGTNTDASVADLSVAVADDMSQTALDMSTVDLSGNDGGAGACNNLVNAAAVVQQTVVNLPMPAPTMGGSIVSGTYYLTDSKIYQGAPPGEVPLQLQVTQSITGTSVQSVQHIVNSPNSLNEAATYTTSGTTLTVTFTCGSNGMGTLGFDATATQYTTYNNAGKLVNVWTRQ